MTKKSLSDLLKEEVNKADAPDAAATPKVDIQAETEEKESVPKATAGRRASRSSGSGRRTATSRKTTKPATAAANPVQAKAGIKTTATQGEAETVAPAADLTQQVRELEKELAATRKDKAQLEKTVAGLQKDLETQQSRLFELKDSLDQSEAATKDKTEALVKIQAELDEAKQTILKLAEAPARSTRRISGADITPRRPVEVKDKPTYYRGVPDYAIQKGQPKPMLTDADIGWVD